MPSPTSTPNFETQVAQTLRHADLHCKDNTVLVFGDGTEHFIAAAQGCALNVVPNPARGVHRERIEVGRCPQGVTPPLTGQDAEARFPTAHAESGEAPLAFVKFPDYQHHHDGERVFRKMATDVGMRTIRSAKAVVMAVPYAYLLDRHFIALEKSIETLAMILPDRHHVTMLKGTSTLTHFRTYGSLHLVILMPTGNPPSQEDVMNTLQDFLQTASANNPPWLSLLSFLTSKEGENNVFLFDAHHPVATRAWVETIKQYPFAMPDALRGIRDDEVHQQVLTQFEQAAAEGISVFQTLFDTRNRMAELALRARYASHWNTDEVHRRVTPASEKSLAILIQLTRSHIDLIQGDLLPRFRNYVSKVEPELDEIRWTPGSGVFMNRLIPLLRHLDVVKAFLGEAPIKLRALEEYEAQLIGDLRLRESQCQHFLLQHGDGCAPYADDQGWLASEMEKQQTRYNATVDFFNQRHASYQNLEAFYQQSLFYTPMGQQFHENYLAVLEELEQTDDYPQPSDCHQAPVCLIETATRGVFEEGECGPNRRETTPETETDPLGFDEVLAASLRVNMGCVFRAMGVFGKTGSTKTTIVAASIKCNLTYTQNPDPDNFIKELVIIERCPEGVTPPVLGHTEKSQTAFLEAHVQPGPNPLTMVDSPGFEDTNESVRLVRMMSTHVGMQRAEGFQGLTLAVPFDYLADPRLVELEHDLRIFSGMFKGSLAAHQQSLHLVISKVPRNHVISKQGVIYKLKQLSTRANETVALDPSMANQNFAALLTFFTSKASVDNLFIFDPTDPATLEAWLETAKQHPMIPTRALTLVGSEEVKQTFMTQFNDALTAAEKVLRTLVETPKKMAMHQQTEQTLLDELRRLKDAEIVRKARGRAIKQDLQVSEAYLRDVKVDMAWNRVLFAHVMRYQALLHDLKTMYDKVLPSHQIESLKREDKLVDTLLQTLQGELKSLETREAQFDLEYSFHLFEQEQWALTQGSIAVQKDRERSKVARRELQETRGQLQALNVTNQDTLARFEHHQAYYQNLATFCQLGFDDMPLCQQLHDAFQQLNLTHTAPNVTRCTVKQPTTLEKAEASLRHSIFGGEKERPIRVDVAARPVCLPAEKPQGNGFFSCVNRAFQWAGNATGLMSTEQCAAPTQSRALR